MRIIRARTPLELFLQVDYEKERLPTVTEVMQLRINTFDHLCRAIPEVKENMVSVASTVLKELHKPEYTIWTMRPTTSTTLIHALDMAKVERVFFYDGDIFDSRKEVVTAFARSLSDGGICINPKILHKLDPAKTANMEYAQFLGTKGGNFTIDEWICHPIFLAACQNDRKIMREYGECLKILDGLSFYLKGQFAGWRPGNMKRGYGRPISLGFKGEAFYPPNNDTVDHMAVILTKNQIVSRLSKQVKVNS